MLVDIICLSLSDLLYVPPSLSLSLPHYLIVIVYVCYTCLSLSNVVYNSIHTHTQQDLSCSPVKTILFFGFDQNQTR